MDWPHFPILVLAVFSIAYAIMKEAAVYFSGKSHLSRWVLYVLLSGIAVLLRYCVPSVFPYLLIFAVAGGAEILGDLTACMKGGARQSLSKKSVKAPEESFSQVAAGRACNADKEADVKPIAGAAGIQIINDEHVYGQDEFIRESRGRRITLSPYLRSNLEKAKGMTDNKPKVTDY